MLASATPTSYEPPPLVANPVEHVDTLIGTGSGGKSVGEINNFPGPSVPFGMVQYSPDTVDNYAGYSHSNKRATGFSMTHASVGCPAFGDISMLPTTRPVGSQPWDANEEIAHDKHERGVPGYYAVRLPSAGVTAELTATNRTGVGRFHYPRDRAARFFVRSGGSLGGNSADKIQIGGDNTTITGSATSGGFCGKNNVYTVYFVMKFNKPFTSFGTWDGFSVFPNGRSAYSSYQGSSGGYVEFPAGTDIEVRTALSYVDVDGARKNLDEAAAGFDDIRAAASKEWNAALSRIKIAGYTEDDIVTFYSALYHALLNPNTFNDVDGRYIGFDGQIHTIAAGHTQYANYSDWDTYRGVAALQGMVFPREASDMAQSLVNDAEQSGSYPRWALANTATAEMTGDSVVALIANFYAFGAQDFDVHRALHFMLDAATEGGVGRNGYVERPKIETYLRRGYLPLPTTSCHGSFPAASISLEWSVDDFAISQFAAALDDSKTAGAIPGPGTVLAEPVQSHHAFDSAAQWARLLSRWSGGGAARGRLLQPGRIRRGQRRAIRLVRAAEHRRPGDRARWPASGGRPARQVHLAAQRRPREAVPVGRQRAHFPGAVAVQLHRPTVEDTGLGRPGA